MMEPVDSSEQEKTFPSLAERLAVSDKELGIRKGTPKTKKEYVRLIHDYLEPYSKNELRESDIGKKMLVYHRNDTTSITDAVFKKQEEEGVSYFNDFFIGTLKDIINTRGKITGESGTSTRNDQIYYIFTNVQPFYPVGIDKRNHKRELTIRTVTSLETNLKNLKDALKLCDDNDLDTLLKDLTGLTGDVRERFLRNPQTAATMTLREKLRIENEPLAIGKNPGKFQYSTEPDKDGYRIKVLQDHYWKNPGLPKKEGEKFKAGMHYEPAIKLDKFPDVIIFPDKTYHFDKTYYVFSDERQKLKLVKIMADMGIISVQTAFLILQYLGVSREEAEEYIREEMEKQSEATRTNMSGLYPGLKLIKGGTKRRYKKQRKTRKQRRR